MRKPILLLLLNVLCVTIGLQAQLLTTSPAFPSETSVITITADCSRGNKGLMNYANTNDVYVHVGAITSASTGASDWKYVKFTWGTADAAAKATSLGNNLYQYTINNPRTFFGVAAGETILKIAILFRNGSGSTVQRNSDGSDMYLSMYTTSLAGQFAEPFFEPRYKPAAETITKVVGDKIRVNYQTNKAANLQLYFNGTQIHTETAATAIIDSPQITVAGNQQIVVKGTDGTGSLADTISFFVSPSVVTEPLPAGVRDGINYEQGDTSAILVLYAPNKTKVTVLGDFNNWTEGTAWQMKKTPDGLRFWLRITGLTPGTEYAYQYSVDNSLKIADPYTQKVLDPDNDPYITSTTYPNLKAYPTGKTTGIVSVLQTAEPSYTWQVNNFVRPDKRGLVIYELLVRDIVAAHDFKTLKDTINYFKTLGVNAIEIMPFNEFEGNVSWGYNTSFYFAPDKYYGPKSTLKAFVDECHKQGIAVVMDIALNHSFGQSPMVQLYFDAANGRPSADNPWFNPVAKHAYNVGYDMNHESAATQYFVSRVVEHWLKEYKLDGFRFDLSKGFTQKQTCDANGANCNVDQWSAYDASRVAIWKKYYDTVQLKSTGSYVILEHFADNTEEKELSAYGMMLWGNLNYAFNEATMGYLAGSNFEQGLSTVRGWTNPYLVTYMESHDEERLMYKNINYGNVSGSYSVKDLNTGLLRNEMAAAFCFTMPGPKMIWQFGELGYDYSINYCQNGTVNDNCRTDAKPIKWDYLQNTNRKHLHDTYAALLKLRAHALYKDAFLTNRVDRSLAGAFKWLTVTTDTSNVMVIGNFDVTAATGSVVFQQAGTWYDYLNNTTITATGSAQSITLQPGEFHVYLNRNITGVSTPVTEIGNDGIVTRLNVYPNPVKNSVIEYELGTNATIDISLLNIYGQKLRQLYSGFRAKGTYKLSLDAQQLPKGIYLVQLLRGNSRMVQKIVVQ
ncbi:MAG: alpha-amylase family glycosyl hydrolase [Chitinophagaceae bacterium]